MNAENMTARNNIDSPELSVPSSYQTPVTSRANNINNRAEQIKLKRGLIPRNYKSHFEKEEYDLIDDKKESKHNSSAEKLKAHTIIEQPMMPLIRYDEAWNHFKKIGSLYKTPDDAPNNYTNKYMCINRICSCLAGQLDNELKQERNICVNLSRARYDCNNEIHFSILFKIYYFFKKKNCTKIGEHWQDIGFQGDEPDIDLLTIGIFGPLQILYCIDTYPIFSLELFLFLVPRKCDWLYAVTMFSLSKFIIQMVNQGVLNYYFNGNHNVHKVLNEIFVGMVFHFKKNIEDYSKNNCLTAEFIAKTIQHIKDMSYTNIVYFLTNHSSIR